MIYADSKVYKNNQILIPSEIRKKFNIKKDDIAEWVVDDEGNISLKFRKKITFDDMRGSIKLDHKTNSVKLKKELYDYE